MSPGPSADCTAATDDRDPGLLLKRLAAVFAAEAPPTPAGLPAPRRPVADALVDVPALYRELRALDSGPSAPARGQPYLA